MVDFALVPERAALINVDLQNSFVERASEGLAVLERVNRLAALCRDAGMMVIHTRHVLRPDGSNMGVLRELVPKIRDGLASRPQSAATRRRGKRALGTFASCSLATLPQLPDRTPDSSRRRRWRFWTACL